MTSAGAAHHGRAGSAAVLEALRNIEARLQTITRMQEEQGAELREVRRLMPRKRGGAPPTYNWVSVRRAVLRHANQKRVETRAEIWKVAMEVIETWRDQPEERTIRNFVNDLAEDFGLDEG